MTSECNEHIMSRAQKILKMAKKQALEKEENEEGKNKIQYSINTVSNELSNLL